MPAGEPYYWTRLQNYPQWSHPIPRLEWPEGVREALEKVAAKLGAERAAAENALTEQQFIEAMRQALACGDFTRLCVIGGDRQGVIYVPFQECERLKARIRELEAELEEAKKFYADDHL